MNKNEMYGRDKVKSPKREKKEAAMSLSHADKHTAITIIDENGIKSKVVVPSSQYVKSLEDEIKQLKQSLRTIDSKIRTINVSLGRKMDKK